MDINELPLGFGMMLAKNEQALIRFGNMPEESRRALLAKAGNADSKDEMQAIVDSICS